MTRECEMKMELRSEQEAQSLLERAAALGFVDQDERTELDFVPDTDDFACRKAGLLLRFRLVRRPGASTPQVLVALKVKNVGHSGVQDNEELEFFLHDGARAAPILGRVNDVLHERVHVALPADIGWLTDFAAVFRLAVYDLGMSQRRALVEKRRRTFARGESVLSVDTFPENVGRYLELETRSPEAVFALADELRLDRARLDPRPYGRIVEARKQDRPEAERRTCVFDDTREVLGQFLQNQ
jgi:adenylate cyclase class IV